MSIFGFVAGLGGAPRPASFVVDDAAVLPSPPEPAGTGGATDGRPAAPPVTTGSHLWS